MTEVEKRENEALKKCLKEAYGYSDEQLRKEMEEAEQSLNDSDFPGAEERIYQKIMEREAAEKKAANTGAGTNAPDRKKAVRLGKKRVFLVAILAAAFVGLLGLTAVGEKSYFFRMREANKGIIFDVGDNLQKASSLERAYEEIENHLGVEMLKLNYIPSKLQIEEISIEDGWSEIRFDYDGNKIYYVQAKKHSETSIGVNSDRKEKNSIWNDWLKKEITFNESKLEDGQSEYEAQIIIEDVLYSIYGKMELEEFTNIVKNMSFY